MNGESPAKEEMCGGGREEDFDTNNESEETSTPNLEQAEESRDNMDKEETDDDSQAGDFGEKNDEECKEEDTDGDEEVAPIPQNDPPQPCRAAPNEGENLGEQVAAIRTDLQYLTHQVYRILLSLHVPPCACEVCLDRHAEQNEIIVNATRPHPSSVLEQDEEFMDTVAHGTAALYETTKHPAARAIEQQEYDTDESSEPSLGPVNFTREVSMVSNGEVEDEAKTYDSLHIARGLQGGILPGFLRERAKRGRGAGGRRSKYCTAEQKSAIAQYASEHGASAAARKFSVSPAVASYYHRKMYNRTLPKGRRPVAENSGQFDFSPATPTDNSLNLLASAGGGGSIAPKLEAQDSFEEARNLSVDSSHDSYGEVPPSPGAYITNGGSPQIRAFNNGKGRGRPRLIGDQLDAELIEHLAGLMRDSHIHLNPERVLKVATKFIAEKSPGLLIEEGGTVQLRTTWAAKTLVRVKEMLRMERNVGLDQYVGNIVAAVKQQQSEDPPGPPPPPQTTMFVRQNGPPTLTPIQSYKPALSVAVNGTTTATNRTTTHTLVLSPVNSLFSSAGTATTNYITIAPKQVLAISPNTSS